MADESKPPQTGGDVPVEHVEGIELVPRFTDQGYSEDHLRKRRDWVQRKAGVDLPLVAACAIAGEAMRGNIENPIGSVQMPLGVAGPLRVNGMHAQGTFYVPFATTEGALVRSYERGMVMLTRAGGVSVARHRRRKRRLPDIPVRVGGRGRGVREGAARPRRLAAPRSRINHPPWQIEAS